MELSQEQLCRLKSIELDVLSEVDRVCRLHKIQYSLVAGTLLGAVRHEGFIPWDDDVDIIMRRSEYERFQREALKELDEKYYFVDYHTKGYGHLFAKIMVKNTVMKEYCLKKNSAPNGIFIDVFIYDNSPDDVRLKERQFKRCRRIKKRLLCREGYYFGQKGARWAGYKLWGKLLSCVPKRYFISRFEREATRYRNVDCENVISLCGDTAGISCASLPSESVTGLVELKFEGKKFLAYSGYKKLLENLYGDYMTLPPKELQVPHHAVLDFFIENDS